MELSHCHCTATGEIIARKELYCDFAVRTVLKRGLDKAVEVAAKELGRLATTVSVVESTYCNVS